MAANKGSVSYETDKPTVLMAQKLQQAFDFFNKELFEDKLPQAMIVMLRKKNMLGYYRDKAWQNGSPEKKAGELCLNPDFFEGRSVDDVLSTLVHEQVHLQQFSFFKPSRGGYHNREWANLMKDVGLFPSDTGEEGGKETGQRMNHYIVDGGRFHKACDKFLKETSFALDWTGIPAPVVAKSTKLKSRYETPSGVKVWGAPGLSLLDLGSGEEFEEITG